MLSVKGFSLWFDKFFENWKKEEVVMLKIPLKIRCDLQSFLIMLVLLLIPLLRLYENANFKQVDLEDIEKNDNIISTLIVQVLTFAVKPLLSSFWPKIQLQWQIPKESKRYQEKSQGPKMTRFLQRFLLKTLLLRFHPQLKKIWIDIKKSKSYILRGLTLVFT